MPKLPWELLTPFSDFVRGLPSRQKGVVVVGGGGGGGGGEDNEEEDEDEMQAHQDSMQRLRVGVPFTSFLIPHLKDAVKVEAGADDVQDADEITKKMTKDEYVHYSDCRQASFTYRKGRRHSLLSPLPASSELGMDRPLR